MIGYMHNNLTKGAASQAMEFFSGINLKPENPLTSGSSREGSSFKDIVKDTVTNDRERYEKKDALSNENQKNFSSEKSQVDDRAEKSSIEQKNRQEENKKTDKSVEDKKISAEKENILDDKNIKLVSDSEKSKVKSKTKKDEDDEEEEDIQEEDLRPIEDKQKDIQELTEVMKNLFTKLEAGKNGKADIDKSGLDKLLKKIEKALSGLESNEQENGKNSETFAGLRSALKFFQIIKDKTPDGQKITLTPEMEREIVKIKSLLNRQTAGKEHESAEISQNVLSKNNEQSKSGTSATGNEGSNTQKDTAKSETHGKSSFEQSFSKGFQGMKSEDGGVKNSSSQNTFRNPFFKDELQEIINSGKLTSREGRGTTLTLKMHPESLGSVNISLGLENGIVTGKFLVDSMDAKNALLQNLDDLKQKLSEQGLNVGNFEVNVRDGKRHFYGKNETPEIINFDHKKNLQAFATMNYDKGAGNNHSGSLDLVI